MDAALEAVGEGSVAAFGVTQVFGGGRGKAPFSGTGGSLEGPFFRSSYRAAN